MGNEHKIHRINGVADEDLSGPALIIDESGKNADLLRSFDQKSFLGARNGSLMVWGRFREHECEGGWIPVSETEHWPVMQMEPWTRESAFVDCLMAGPVLWLPDGRVWKKGLAQKDFLDSYSQDVFFAALPDHCPGRAVLFLDRDGIVNEDHGYVYREEDFRFTSWAFDLFEAAKKAGVEVIMLTNQSGIARGYYHREDAEKLHSLVDEKLRQKGIEPPRWFFSPWHVDGVGEFAGRSLTRKPWPGMLLQAAGEKGIDLERCLMVGDKDSDNLLVPGLSFVALDDKYPLVENRYPICSNGVELVKWVATWLQRKSSTS